MIIGARRSIGLRVSRASGLWSGLWGQAQHIADDGRVELRDQIAKFHGTLVAAGRYHIRVVFPHAGTWRYAISDPVLGSWRHPGFHVSA
jgi:hypothetical protein